MCTSMFLRPWQVYGVASRSVGLPEYSQCPWHSRQGTGVYQWFQSLQTSVGLADKVQVSTSMFSASTTCWKCSSHVCSIPECLTSGGVYQHVPVFLTSVGVYQHIPVFQNSRLHQQVSAVYLHCAETP